MYYQHDGVPPHVSQGVRQYLNHKFPNRWIGHGGAQKCSPRSPGLNPLNYHVWGYLKAMVYAHERRTTPANSQHCKKHQQHCSAS